MMMKSKSISLLLGTVLMSAPFATAQAAPPQKPESPGLERFVGCSRLASKQQAVKFTFRPDSKLTDLIQFMSTVSCTPFMAPQEVDLTDKRFTIPALDGRVVSAEELYRHFLAALASNGLTVRPSAKILLIIPGPR